MVDLLWKSPVATVGAVALMVGGAGCQAETPMANVDRTELDAAQNLIARECPGGTERFSRDLERAHAGDIEAIDCVILDLRAQALLADHSEALGRFDDVPDYAAGELSDALHRDELAHFYVRWRLTGERWEELAALARTMPKSDIESVLYLTGFDESLLPQIQTDACGRVAETDPRYQVIQLGTGDRDPLTCDREF